MPTGGSSLEIYGGPLSQSRCSIQVACCVVREALRYFRQALESFLPIVERWQVTPADFFVFWKKRQSPVMLRVNRVTLSPKLSSIFFSKNAFSPSSSSPHSYLYHTHVQSIKRKITVKVCWLKVKSHGPGIRAHRCGAFGRLTRAAPWLRRRFNLNQYAVEQGSSDWLIILVSLGILIISF